jgi:hypothetical protein
MQLTFVINRPDARSFSLSCGTITTFKQPESKQAEFKGNKLLNSIVFISPPPSDGLPNGFHRYRMDPA